MKKILDMISTLKKDNKTIIEYINSFKQIPKTYELFQNNPDLVEEYTRMGILLQGNYKSLLGKYGSKAKKTLKILLKKDLITFLGSDIHHIEDYQIDKAYKKVKRIVKDENRVVDIFSNNFNKVITNEEI